MLLLSSLLLLLLMLLLSLSLEAWVAVGARQRGVWGAAAARRATRAACPGGWGRCRRSRCGARARARWGRAPSRCGTGATRLWAVVRWQTWASAVRADTAATVGAGRARPRARGRRERGRGLARRTSRVHSLRKPAKKKKREREKGGKRSMEESYGCVSDWGKMSKQGEREKKRVVGRARRTCRGGV